MSVTTSDLIETFNQRLLPMLRSMVGQADALETAVYIVALLALVLLALLACRLAWQALVATRARWGAMVLALLLVLPAAIVFKFSYGNGPGLPLLRPLELLNVLALPFQSLLVGEGPWVSLRQDVRLRLAATLTLLLLVLVVALAAVRRAGPALRAGGLALAVSLCVFPVSYLGQATVASAKLARVYAEGQALFDAKCQTVGAKRLRSGAQADGIRLTRLRGEAGDERYEDAQWPGAGIPRDRVGQAYIESFLDFRYLDTADHPGWNSGLLGGQVTMGGFQFVDVEQGEGRFLRYRRADGTVRSKVVTEEIPATAAARYAVSVQSTGTAQERANWVAGAVVSVTDTETGELLGELRTAAYAPPSRRSFDDPQRRNWQLAQTCPPYGDVPDAMVRMFVGKVVAPVRAP